MRRTSAAVTILVVIFALLAAPAAMACPYDERTPHPCCGAPADMVRPEVGRCCSAGQLDGARSATADGRDPVCDCVHSPLTPPVIEVATAAHGPEHSLAVADLDPVVRVAAANPSRPAQRSTPLPRSTLKPLFLLDCAFLI